MSFRLKLFLSIVTAVFVTVLIESGVDFSVERNRATLQAQTEEDLRQYTRRIVDVLDLDDLGNRPEEEARQHLHEAVNILVLNGEALSRLPGESLAAFGDREGRYRVVAGGEVLLSSPRAFPQSGFSWATRDRDLGGGFFLEVALERTLSERILSNPFLLQAIDLPLFFALAFVVAWLLTRLVMKPVRKLTEAFEQISTQQFPEPIPVPDDRDELSQMARSFNRMSNAIQGLLERERTFTRYASHELRTPVSTLKLQIDRAEMGLATPETVMPVLKRQVQRMEETLSTLLALSRSSERDLKPTPLRRFVQDLLATLPQDAKERVTLHDKTRVHLNITDARLVLQALGNLLENALRYSNGPVALGVETHGKMVTFSVKDSGPGVPEELLGMLTKPFFRVGNHIKSLGLGLSLVENVAHSLKGTLELKNVHPGLEAVLTLPIVVLETPSVSEAGRVAIPRDQAKNSRHSSTTPSNSS